MKADKEEKTMMDDKQTRMDLHDSIEQVPVPAAKVNAAIMRGLAQGKKPQRFKKYALAAAAALLLGTGGLAALNPHVGQALSNVGWLSSFYLQDGGADHFNTFHVNGIAENLNQTAASHGLTVKLAEAYYNGRTIGITGEVTGMSHAQIYMNGEDELGIDAPAPKETGFSQDSLHFHPTKTGYHFSLTYQTAADQVPQSLTLPLRFKSINNVLGRWSFKLHLSQPAIQTQQLGRTEYDLKLPGVTATGLSMSQYHTGAELQLQLKFDQRYDEVSIRKISDAKGQQLIDRAVDYGRNQNDVLPIPLTQPLKAGESYRVQIDYFLKGHQRGQRVDRQLILLPADK